MSNYKMIISIKYFDFSARLFMLCFLVSQTIYSFLHKPADDLYQNIPKSISVALAAKTVDQDANVTPSSLLYENIPTKMKTELGFSFADS